MKTEKRSRLLLAAAVILVIAALGIFFLRGEKQDAAKMYRPVIAKKGDLALTVISTGTVQPENRLEIKPPIAGRADKVLVKEGQKVKKGQILMWMSSTERAALLDAARAKGAAELKKWEELYKPAPVIAPINGTIIARNIEAGQTFTATDAVLVMSDRLTVKAQVDETDIAQVKTNQKAKIVLDAYPHVEIPATVDQIAYDATTVNNVTTYVVDVLPDKTADFMKSGMTATVTFSIAEVKDALLVPSEAIQTHNGHSMVLVQTPQGPQQRIVQVGHSDGKRTEITDGLKEGEAVLVYKAEWNKSANQRSLNPFSPHHGKHH